MSNNTYDYKLSEQKDFLTKSIFERIVRN